MNNAKFFYLLLALLYVVPISAQEGKTDEVTESTDADFDGDDEDWLNTVWTQVDGMVAQEELQTRNRSELDLSFMTLKRSDSAA